MDSNLAGNCIHFFRRCGTFFIHKSDDQMNRIFHILFFLISISSGLQAQTEILNKSFMNDVQFNQIIEGTYLRLNMKISDVQGTPYLNDKFEPGKITTLQDLVFENIALRYNAFTDNLEFKQRDSIFNIAFKTIVKKAEFDGNTFSCRSFETNGVLRDGFFKILKDGKATLLARYTIKFLDKEEAKAFSDYQPARFEDPDKQYFIAFEGAPAQLISNKKSLVRMFGAHQNEMESFISKNKLSIKDDEEMVKIISHFNTL